MGFGLLKIGVSNLDRAEDWVNRILKFKLTRDKRIVDFSFNVLFYKRKEWPRISLENKAQLKFSILFQNTVIL